MNDRKLFKNNQLGKRASFSKGTYEQGNIHGNWKVQNYSLNRRKKVTGSKQRSGISFSIHGLTINNFLSCFTSVILHNDISLQFQQISQFVLLRVTVIRINSKYNPKLSSYLLRSSFPIGLFIFHRVSLLKQKLSMWCFPALQSMIMISCAFQC